MLREINLSSGKIFADIEIFFGTCIRSSGG